MKCVFTLPRKTSRPIFLGLWIFALPLVQGCSVRILGVSSFPSTEFQPGLGPSGPKRFVDTSTFLPGSEASYAFTPGIEFSAQGGRLASVAQSDFDASTFTGSGNGASFSAGSARLSSTSACDGTNLNCSALDPSWTPGYTSDPATNHLLAYYPLDTDGRDLTGNAPLVNLGGTPTFTQLGKVGSHAMSVLNGSALVASDPSKVAPTSTLSLSLWFKTTHTTQNAGLLGKWISGGGGSTENSFVLYTGADSGSNQVGIVLAESSAQYKVLNSNNSRYQADIWNHVVATADGSFIHLYLNGKEVGSPVAYDGTIYPANLPLVLGRLRTGDPTYSFDGDLDEVAVWDSALSSTEIRLIYDRQAPKFSGTYTSRVIDSGNPVDYESFRWNTSFPFGKEISNGHETSTDYPSLSSDSTVSNGLMGLWHFNETTLGSVNGADFKDSVGGGNGYTLNSLEKNLPGKLGNAIGSHAANAGARLPVDLSGTKTVTLAAWVNFEPSPSSVVPMIFEYTANFNSGNGMYISPKDCQGSDYPCSFTIATHDLSQGYRVMHANALPFGWHHVVVTIDRTTVPNEFQLFVDGVPQTLHLSSIYGIDSTAYFANDSLYLFGRQGCGGCMMNGSLDELGVWNRRLTSQEVTDLYHRGSAKVNFQIRSCTSADCSNPADSHWSDWRGPDGTRATVFSEMNNRSTPNDFSSELLASAPNFLFSTFTAPPNASRFFQYRSVLSSEIDPAQFGPELNSVTVGPPHRYAGLPTLKRVAPLAYGSLNGFSESLGTAGCAGGVHYTLSKDGTLWYYFTAGQWTLSDGSFRHASDAATLNSNLSTFDSITGGKTLYWQATLKSNGLQNCELSTVSISGTP
ncbi:MAG: LamG domain-containing protein [Cryobacterium sp.]|nr:LamG domain-containing protein [Oligoflexia bacterium]